MGLWNMFDLLSVSNEFCNVSLFLLFLGLMLIFFPSFIHMLFVVEFSLHK